VSLLPLSRLHHAGALSNLDSQQRIGIQITHPLEAWWAFSFAEDFFELDRLDGKTH
jgi:hypothetical protein